MRRANMTLFYSDISYETVTAAVKIQSRKQNLPAEVLVIDLSLNRSVQTVSDSIINWLKFLNVRITGNVNLIVTSVTNLNYISTLPKLRRAQFEMHALQEIRESFKQIDYFYKQDIIERGDLGTFVYTYLINNEIFQYLNEITRAIKLRANESPLSVYDLMYKTAIENDLTEGLVFYFSNGEFYLSLIVNDTWIDGMYIKDIKDTKKITNRINLFLIKHRSNLNLSLDKSLVICAPDAKTEELQKILVERFNANNVLNLNEKLEYNVTGTFRPYRKIRP